MSANGIGDIALIQPGVECWSATRGWSGADAIEDDKPGAPIGGLVYRVTEKVNRETGEIERSFMCVDHTRTRPRLRTCVLLESEIDRSREVGVVSDDRIRHVWRRASEDIAFVRRYKDRTGPAVAEEARLGLIVFELLGLIFGAAGILNAALTPPRSDQAPTIRPDAPVNVSALVD